MSASTHGAVSMGIGRYFFAVMGNLYQHTHTYANIQREKCFCINFLPISMYDRLIHTIHCNDLEEDEFAAGGFTLDHGKAVHAPVIREAFVTMECTMKDIQDLSGAGITSMITGEPGQSAIATVNIERLD